MTFGVGNHLFTKYHSFNGFACLFSLDSAFLNNLQVSNLFSESRLREEREVSEFSMSTYPMFQPDAFSLYLTGSGVLHIQSLCSSIDL